MKFTEEQRRYIKGAVTEWCKDVRWFEWLIDRIESILSEPERTEAKDEKSKVFYSALKHTSDLPISNMKLFKELAFDMMDEYATIRTAALEAKVKELEIKKIKKYCESPFAELARLESEIIEYNKRISELEELNGRLSSLLLSE